MWKKMVVITILLVAIAMASVLMALEKPDTGSQPITPYGRWHTVGVFSSTGGDPVDLIKSVRTYKKVQAKITAAQNNDDKIILKILDFGFSALRFRLDGLTENDVIVLQIYTGAMDGYIDCNLVKRGTLTFTIGGQGTIKSSYEYADTVVVTNDEATTKAWVVVSPGNDTCAEVFLDFQGDDVICAVGTSIPCNAELFLKDF